MSYAHGAGCLCMPCCDRRHAAAPALVDPLELQAQALRDAADARAADRERRRQKVVTHLQDRSKNPDKAPRWLLKPCKADHCERYADFIDGFCNLHHSRRAAHGDHRIARQLVSRRQRDYWMAEAWKVIERHAHDPVLKDIVRGLNGVMHYHAGPRPPSWRGVFKKADHIEQGMEILRGANFKPARVLQVMLAHLMWRKEAAPAVPDRAIDVALSRWLIQLADIDPRDKRSLLARSRFLACLGEHLRSYVYVTALVVYQMKDQKPVFNRNEYMKLYMRARRRGQKRGDGTMPPVIARGTL
jgi:hypothetical protein